MIYLLVFPSLSRTLKPKETTSSKTLSLPRCTMTQLMANERDGSSESRGPKEVMV